MKRLLLFVMLLALALSLSGCFLEPAESLYAVPKQSQDFYNLQRAIEKVMPPKGAYSPPMSGENQQAVQLSDLDGDGEDEAVVYLKAGGSEPLSICIFAKREDRYELIDKINGSGSAFDRVQYAQIDGQPGKEIVVGRRISEQVTQTLHAYTLMNGKMVEILNANYDEFITTDLDSDEKTDVILLRTEGDTQKGIAEFYHWSDGQLVRQREVRMSTPASAVKRIITGQMCQNVPAAFVASEYGEGTIVTDVFGCVDGVFTNISLPEDTDTSVQTVREYYVYSCDIDSDGLIELPRLISLPSIPEDSSSENQSLISWYNLQLDGSMEEKALTYHNYSGGWYVTVRPQWAERLTVSRVAVLDGTQGYSFSLLDGEKLKPQFTIAALTGENRQQIPQESDWEVLTEKGEVLYVCHVEEGSLSLEILREMFHFIQVDWNTGET